MDFQELFFRSKKLEQVARKIQVHNEIGLSQEQIDEFRDEYDDWYTDCLTILPDDFKAPFIAEFEGNWASSTIKKFIENPTKISPIQTDNENNKRLFSYWLYPCESSFCSPLHAQQRILRQANKRHSNSSPPEANPSVSNQNCLQVFLCYSSADKAKVLNLYKKLKNEEEINPWMSEEDLLPGQDSEQESLNQLHKSDVFISCLSREAISKEGVNHRDIKIALDVALSKPSETIFIIPLKLEECTVPLVLKRLQPVKLFEKHGYERLLKALRKRMDELQFRDSLSA